MSEFPSMRSAETSSTLATLCGSDYSCTSSPHLACCSLPFRSCALSLSSGLHQNRFQQLTLEVSHRGRRWLSCKQIRMETFFICLLPFPSFLFFPSSSLPPLFLHPLHLCSLPFRSTPPSGT